MFNIRDINRNNSEHFVYGGGARQLKLLTSKQTGNSVLAFAGPSYISHNINKTLPPKHVYIECFNGSTLSMELVLQGFARYIHTVQDGCRMFDVLYILLKTEDC